MKSIRLLTLLLSSVSAAVFTVNGQLRVTVSPTYQSASPGGGAKFTANATGGTLPYTWQWQANGHLIDTNVNLSAATQILSITNVSLADAGAYVAIVTDATSATTNSAAVQFNVDPTFTKITTGPVVTDTGRSGVGSWGDYDNDGYIDLLVRRCWLGVNGFYHNNGDGTFTSITNVPFVQSAGGWTTLAWGDYDNDGLLDVAVATLGEVAGPLDFFRNNGDATFTATPSPGAEYPIHLAWADYDRDGFLDLLVPNFYAKTNDTLYQNKRDGTFRSVTKAEVGSIVGYGTANGSFCAWGDYDDDGWPDLVAIANPILLHHNLGGQFERVTTTNAVVRGSGHRGAWGDYDNDGRLDLFVAVWGGQNLLYHNLGNGAFVRVTTGPVVTDTGGGGCTGGSWADYDNDGFLDLVVADYLGTSRLYHNKGDGTFTRVTTGSPVNERASPAVCGTMECIWMDYDNDGFLDLFVANGHNVAEVPTTSFLYRNNGNSNAWLTIKLVGTASNRMAIGAKVRVKATYRGQERWQRRDISGADSKNGNQLYAHLGFGDATNIDLVRIEWPSGIVQELANVAPKQILTITEPARLRMAKPGELQIQCWQGQAFEVQVSPDLATWSTAATVTNMAGTLAYTDPDAGTPGRRFYRAVAR